jgi:hypothetical protein
VSLYEHVGCKYSVPWYIVSHYIGP